MLKHTTQEESFGGEDCFSRFPVEVREGILRWLRPGSRDYATLLVASRSFHEVVKRNEPAILRSVGKLECAEATRLSREPPGTREWSAKVHNETDQVQKMWEVIEPWWFNEYQVWRHFGLGALHDAPARTYERLVLGMHAIFILLLKSGTKNYNVWEDLDDNGRILVREVCDLIASCFCLGHRFIETHFDGYTKSRSAIITASVEGKPLKEMVELLFIRSGSPAFEGLPDAKSDLRLTRPLAIRREEIGLNTVEIAENKICWSDGDGKRLKLEVSYCEEDTDSEIFTRGVSLMRTDHYFVPMKDAIRRSRNKSFTLQKETELTNGLRDL